MPVLGFSSTPSLPALSFSTGSGALSLLLVSADFGGIEINFGAKVAQANQRFGLAAVLEDYSILGAVLSTEAFVLRELCKADELGTVERHSIDFAGALNTDKTISSVVFD